MAAEAIGEKIAGACLLSKDEVHYPRVLKSTRRTAVMYRTSRFLLALLLTFFSTSALVGQSVTSPDERITVSAELDDWIDLTIQVDGQEEAKIERVTLETLELGALGLKPRLRSQRTSRGDDWVEAVVSSRNKRIHDHYNELLLTFRGNFALRLRAYNNGVAYRWETSARENLTIVDETASFVFPTSNLIWFPEEESLNSHNERGYPTDTLRTLKPGQFCSLVMLTGPSDGPKLMVMESNLRDYPGLWLRVGEDLSLDATFPGFPKTEELLSDRDFWVTESEDYIAKVNGERSFPWRILAVAHEDKDLLENDLVFLLSDPLELEDPSWIEPGLVAWDWYNNLNLTGVDFEAGVNTETYNYFIDFAAEYDIPYIILDEGWYVLGDVLDISPDVDLPAIMRHANEKGVGVILWVVWKTLDDRLDEALAAFEAWGVKGIKVDFMQRDDQPTVQWYEMVARKAAEHKLLVDYHGAYKPAGLRRRFPNMITREGVVGAENNKWSDRVTPTHNVTLPFTRMVPGPMDYTPGAMRNAHKANFTTSFDRPMSLGTRAHQLAMYVVFESPLQMLCDSPSLYLQNKDILLFLSDMPTTWDETVPLGGEIGDFVAVARRAGDEWYVAAMTNEDTRNLSYQASFLDEETRYEMTVFTDGANAARNAEDYRKTTGTISANGSLDIKMAGGGGWIAKLTPVD